MTRTQSCRKPIRLLLPLLIGHKQPWRSPFHHPHHTHREHSTLLHIRMATSKIRSFVKKVKKEVSSSSSTFGLRANRRRKSQSLAEIVSREPLGSCTEPAQSSQHAAQLSDAYDDAPLDQRECTLNLPAAITVTQPRSSGFRKSSTRKLGDRC